MIIRIDTTSSTPVYAQIIDQIKRAIASGAIRSGDVLPSLRERKEDIPRILFGIARRVLPNPFPCWPIFSTELLYALQRHTWPGNVAELMGIAAELLAKFKGRALEISDLPERFKPRTGETPASTSLEEVETAHIQKVLQSVGGNKSRAAEILKITRKTLGQKMKRIGDS